MLMFLQLSPGPEPEHGLPNLPGKLHVAGRVTMSSALTREFSVTVEQPVQNGPANTGIFVHAKMGGNTLAHVQLPAMPPVGSLVTFAGSLMGVGPGPGVAQVDVDNIVHLPFHI